MQMIFSVLIAVKVIGPSINDAVSATNSIGTATRNDTQIVRIVQIGLRVAELQYDRPRSIRHGKGQVHQGCAEVQNPCCKAPDAMVTVSMLIARQGLLLYAAGASIRLPG